MHVLSVASQQKMMTCASVVRENPKMDGRWMTVVPNTNPFHSVPLLGCLPMQGASVVAPLL